VRLLLPVPLSASAAPAQLVVYLKLNFESALLVLVATGTGTVTSSTARPTQAALSGGLLLFELESMQLGSRYCSVLPLRTCQSLINRFRSLTGRLPLPAEWQPEWQARACHSGWQLSSSVHRHGDIQIP
jgi:hypothetical protein